MKKRDSSISALILGLVLLVLFVLPASAETTSAAPQLPHAFVGMIEVEGISAPDGLIVEAVGPGIRSGTQGNPVTTLTGGVYGRIGMAEQKLLVQGDIESGTPIEFYVGGVKAEVFPVAKNGPWLEAYPYLPGEVTELNLRITSQPAAGQTREPTPVQTRIPSGQVPAIPGYTGPDLPVPEVIATYQPTQTQAGEGTVPAVSTQPGTQEESPGTSVQDSQGAGNPSSVVPAAGSTPNLFIGAAVVAFLVIIGAVAYYTSRKKPDDEKKEE